MMIIIIGGGPAGIMAAIEAKKNNDSVLLLEKKNKIGLKLSITGKGRCNVTNIGNLESILNNFPSGKKFLFSALNQFSNFDLINFFSHIGVDTKVERGGRVFPLDDSAKKITSSLEKYLLNIGVQIRTSITVKNIIIKEGYAVGVVTNSGEIKGKVIIAAGGLSYPKTGSTGDGYSFAEKIGHTLIKRYPSLVPLKLKEIDDIQVIQGVSLKNVEISYYYNKKKKNVLFGESLFTHYGISGPIILSMSRDVVPNLDSGTNTIEIDFKPMVSRDKLDSELINILKENSKKDLINGIKNLLPNKLIKYLLIRTNISEHKKCYEISKFERLLILNFLKNLKFTVVGSLGYENAVVTRGGVSLKEINPKTMESKLIKDLYFAGEVLDIDAYTGGYNLQGAFSTGYVAGKNI